MPIGLGHDMGGAGKGEGVTVMSARELGGVGPVEPGNLLAVAGAGTTLGELDVALAGRGLYWPVTGPHGRTLGGVMGQGLLGAETMAKGHMVNWVLGTTMLAPSGEIVRSGGRTLKNVSGYDLTRLAWRARGSLGMSVSFTLKLLPRPRVCPVMEFKVKSLRVGASHMETIVRDRLGLPALRLIGDKKGLRVVAWMAGFAELVTAQEERLKALMKDPVDLFEDGFEYFNHYDSVFNEPDGSTGVYAGTRKGLLETVRNLSWIGDYSFVCDLGGGRLALTPPNGPTQDLCRETGLVGVSGGAFRATGPLFRRVKAAIDPKSAFLTA